jgi:tetratricopeptide (TPR) repeat protein
VLSREEGLRATRVIAMGYREWAKAALGRRCGLDRMEAVARNEGGLTGGFSLAALLAPAYGHCGRRQEQIALIRELLAGGEAMALPALYYAELYTLLGEALLATGEAAEGEGWLHRAMAAAHTTGDHRQRLRAALALAEQEGQTGRTAEAARQLRSAMQDCPLEAGDADGERAWQLLRRWGQSGEQPQSGRAIQPECDGGFPGDRENA